MATNNLTEAELRLSAAVRDGLTVDFASADEPDESVETGHGWGPERSARGAVVRQIILDASANKTSTITIRGLRIEGSLDLTSQVLRPGLVLEDCYLERALIVQSADIEGITLLTCHLPMITGTRVKIGGDFILDDCALLKGGLELRGATVEGDVVLSHTRMSNADGAALRADDSLVNGKMLLRELDLTDAAVLRGSSVRSDLILEGSMLRSDWLPALAADAVTVGGNLLMYHNTAAGELRFNGLMLQGDFYWRGGRFHAPSGTALSLDAARIGGGVRMEDTSADGLVRMIGAKVGTEVKLRNTQFLNPESLALDLGGLEVHGPVVLTDGFRSVGEVRCDAVVALDITCLEGEIDTLNLQNSVVSGTIDVRTLRPLSSLRLSGVEARTFVDSPSTWPRHLELDGFTYHSLNSSPEVDGKERLGWLRRQQQFTPQPYDQLAASYTARGENSTATRIAIAKHRDRSRNRSLVARIWSDVIFAVNGYGYRPWFSGVWLILLLALGTVIFSSAHPNELTPAKSASEMPPFQPTIYTLDLLIPAIVANLGQRDSWIAHGAAQWWKLAFVVAGWIFAAILVNAVTDALKKRQ